MKNIVILGGSYAGVSTAHRILKNAAKVGSLKITLVSPNTHFYWNFASPRGMLPGQFTDEELFLPIATGFGKYSADEFAFITGSAESFDAEEKTVVVVGESGKTTLEYDMLIIATGTSTKERSPLKGVGSTKETKELLHEFQGKIEQAKTIVVAGAGVTGVEVAGELGFEYGLQKRIILVAAEPTVLPESPTSVSKLTTQALHNMHVELKLETKVIGSTQMPNGGQELQLSTGKTLTTDMYIPTFGLIPNSSFIPARFLNAHGFAAVDTHLQLKGTTDVWALGDVCDVEYCQYVSCDRQSTYVAKSIVAILGGKMTAPYKAMTSRFMGLQIGKKAGTGFYGNLRIPSFLVIWLRKTLFIERFGPLVDGSSF
ncbi:FAD/NAD(P)-binding domain-containing protein [Cucurbitaria berberidis CBS 394.84]|uniref:FAD/NAD(P)-binding domain-containing protein n=1 Tax=Cucurbitaria berberidis CBS 394.84 TaxID=1168544 RepID=A0A9P4GGK8_9PLEO|nr:FAD/NAD(P)-binding domain-containing protein [Cucurbitaria berberidis CBS 394.84]KAF1845718.1 FAD/NAD(P)-binding domain-containing protein [Cucurbitaria berberidis CBS 394.84]